MLKSNKTIKLNCINRFSLESGFALKINNNANLKNSLIKIYNDLEKTFFIETFEKSVFNILTKKLYKNHIEDLVYFFESLKLFKLNVYEDEIIKITKINIIKVKEKLNIIALSLFIKQNILFSMQSKLKFSENKLNELYNES